jgi:hypothetical protein
MVIAAIVTAVTIGMRHASLGGIKPGRSTRLYRHLPG